MNTLSIHRPRPSMETRTSASCNAAVTRGLVNCLPWSVSKMPGRPNRDKASCSASMQKPTSMVFDSHQDRTLRLCQSMRATRHRMPRRIGM